MSEEFKTPEEREEFERQVAKQCAAPEETPDKPVAATLTPEAKAALNTMTAFLEVERALAETKVQIRD